ncbi:MAG: hypothetical protein NTY29_07180, partial [Proteobacteria bacterium]|nr:hypothetical protein [Pseudomonadota bacterium]
MSAFLYFFSWSDEQRGALRLEKILGLALLLGALTLPGCSLKQFAVNRLGDALATGSSVYAIDDDPELVGAALP